MAPFLLTNAVCIYLSICINTEVMRNKRRKESNQKATAERRKAGNTFLSFENLFFFFTVKLISYLSTAHRTPYTVILEYRGKKRILKCQAGTYFLEVRSLKSIAPINVRIDSGYGAHSFRLLISVLNQSERMKLDFSKYQISEINVPV